MASPALDLIINVADPDKKGLCALRNGQVVPGNGMKLPLMVRSDGQTVNYRFVKPSETGARLFDDIDVSAASVRVGIGLPDLAPTDGTFTIKEITGNDDTPAQNCNVIAADVETQINLLPAVIAAGGVTVTSPATGMYQLTFNQVGVQTARFSANTSKLAPLSVATVSRVQVGTADVQEIVLIQLVQNAYAFSNPENPLPPKGSTITPVQAGTSDVPAIQRVTLNPPAYGGHFNMVIVGKQASAIPYDASGADMQAFVGPSYDVTQLGNGDWEIATVENGAIADITVDPAFLLVQIGVTGPLSLNRMEIWRAFVNSRADRLWFIFEIQLQWPGEDPITVYRDKVFLDRNVINLNTLLPATMLGLQTTYTALFGGVGYIYTNQITGLTGGAGKLDGFITTADKALGFRVDFMLNGIPQSFYLKAGAADGTDPTGQVAPTDFNGGSNNKHWERSA